MLLYIEGVSSPDPTSDHSVVTGKIYQSKPEKPANAGPNPRPGMPVTQQGNGNCSFTILNSEVESWQKRQGKYLDLDSATIV